MIRAMQICSIIGTLFAFSAPGVMAASYPVKPIRLIVPLAPGGSIDIVGRLIATRLNERLGMPVVVDNRAGGGGLVGTHAAAKAYPDGYTLLFVGATHTTQPALQKLPYDPRKSFAPIAKLGNGPFILVVHPSVSANSVKELIALAKQKPGQMIFITGGRGGTPHMGIELFKIMADIDITIGHFRGGGPAVIDLLGGHSHAYFAALIQVLPLIKSGKLKVLATGGASRISALPNVPTVAESGLSGYELTQWWGLVAPTGTPAPIVNKLAAELKEIVASDDLKKLFLNNGAEVNYLGPAAFAAFIDAEIEKWTRVAKKANVRLEE